MIVQLADEIRRRGDAQTVTCHHGRDYLGCGSDDLGGMAGSLANALGAVIDQYCRPARPRGAKYDLPSATLAASAADEAAH
jgi:hypothetical protein